MMDLVASIDKIAKLQVRKVDKDNETLIKFQDGMWFVWIDLMVPVSKGRTLEIALKRAVVNMEKRWQKRVPK